MKTKYPFAVFLILVAAVLLVFGFSLLPIEDSGMAIDWKQFWTATHWFQSNYSSTGLRVPPWTLPVIWVFTIFPLNVSWGLAACATLAVLVASVPSEVGKKRWLIGLWVIATSYLTLRQVADGNLEAFVMAGILLILGSLGRKNPWLLAVGILLAATKIQETWLLLIATAVAVAIVWSRRDVMRAFLITLAFSLPFLFWKGGEWINEIVNSPYPGTAVDSSLQATLGRLGLPAFVYWIVWIAVLAITIHVLRKQFWNLGRIEAGMLIIAGLLLAPYAASNSVLTPLAIGVVPFFQEHRRLGLGLLLFYFLPYLALARPDLRAAYESTYWTAVLLLTWLFLFVLLGLQPPAWESAKSSSRADTESNS